MLTQCLVIGVVAVGEAVLRPSPGNIFPLRFIEQAITAAGLGVEVGNKILRIIEVHAHHRMVRCLIVTGRLPGRRGGKTARRRRTTGVLGKGLPLRHRHLMHGHCERHRHSDSPLWAFVRAAVTFARCTAHLEASRRDTHHEGTLFAVLEGRRSCANRHGRGGIICIENAGLRLKCCNLLHRLISGACVVLVDRLTFAADARVSHIASLRITAGLFR